MYLPHRLAALVPVVVFVVLLLTHDRPARAQPADQALERIVFGSCAHQNKPQPIWDQIVKRQPQLFLFIGDNIYGDTTDMAQLQKKYDLLAAVPGYQRLLASCPLWAIWDDHDFGVNDGGREYPRKAESQRVFCDFFHEPADSPRRAREGLYDAKIWGPPGQRTQIVLLDTRYFRSPLKSGGPRDVGKGYQPNEDADATMLGDGQWAWLAEQLRQPAELRILVSSIQVIAEDHSSEKWANFPAQRRKLFELIRLSQAAGVIFLSGDRHLAELSMMNGDVGYPLYDLTSSGLTNGHKKWRGYEPNRHRVATMNWGDNFGEVLVDWKQADPLVRLVVRDEDGEITLQHKMPLSTLRPGLIPPPKP